ncbi:hypothetical protein PMAYCL1PPCAC_16239, partial [Pristionchus mayeri]
QMRQIQTLTLENMRRWIDPLFPVPDRIDITDNVGKRPQLFDHNVAPSQVIVNSPDSKIRAIRSSAKHSRRTLDVNKLNRFTSKKHPAASEKNQQLDEMVQGQGWLEQTWDHFNTNEERTFKQVW